MKPFSIGIQIVSMIPLTTLLIICLFSFSSYSEACTCLPSSTKDKICGLDYVAVVDLNGPSDLCDKETSVCSDIQVLETLKGNSVEPKIIETGTIVPLCGLGKLPFECKYIVGGRLSKESISLDMCNSLLTLVNGPEDPEVTEIKKNLEDCLTEAIQ